MRSDGRSFGLRQFGVRETHSFPHVVAAAAGVAETLVTIHLVAVPLLNTISKSPTCLICVVSLSGQFVWPQVFSLPKMQFLLMRRNTQSGASKLRFTTIKSYA